MKKRLSTLNEKVAPYILLAPFLFVLIVFFGYAFVRVLYFSFTDYDLFSSPKWVWFKNYINLFQEIQFGRALKNSITFAIIVTTCQTFIALVLAVVLNQQIKGIKFFRAAYYMPSVTSSVVITLIFMWIFQKRGLMNYLLTQVVKASRILLVFFLLAVIFHILLVMYEKIRKRPVSIFEPAFIVLSLLLSGIITFILIKVGIISTLENVKPVRMIWLNTRKTWPDIAGPLAFPIPLGAIMILNIWTTAPTFMLLYLAGLQDIPKELYEAAAVDGATKWHTFWYITVPQLKHITFLVVTMGLIGTLQMFDQVAVIGDQAPLDSTITLAYYIYKNVLPSSAIPKVGLASAAAIFLAGLTFIIVLIQKKFVNK
ncbi:ABC transporter permease [Anoxybacter fermentans]|uniref:ABC transporter permease n=1 Tax=Anoxybacter fermentans TaxID=1323375 RepID=A0A3Q9HS27_9FIRM|nr:sugar ABC transporter permease [Anoxybacter fermentans]AZR74456.1 ABC transporter permease [Anoxybacter fermentans]